MGKTCSRCGYQAADDATIARTFDRDGRSSDGRHSHCRQCRRSADRRKTTPAHDGISGAGNVSSQGTIGKSWERFAEKAEGVQATFPVQDSRTANKQVALLGCVHRDDDNDALWYWALDRLRTIRPATIYLMGDFISCSPLSHWPRRTPEIKKYQASKLAAMKAIDELSAFCNHIEYLEGNHEFWAKEYVAAHPELDGHISLEQDLQLPQRGVKWHDNDAPVVTPWGVLHHGNATKSGGTACKWYAEIYAPRFAFKRPVFIANWHHLGTYDAPSGAYCECTGYLGAFRPGYLKSSLPAWAPGFRVVDVEGGVVTKTVAHRYGGTP